MRVIVHAGLGKAGSTAIQFWLGARAAALHGQGVVSLRNVVQSGTTARWERTESGSAKAYRPLGPQSRDPFAHPQEFFESLLELDLNVGTVVLSHENLYSRLRDEDHVFIRFLNEVAARFSTEILIYVRPQHLWLEAAWRQWGFRRPVPASEWILGHSGIIDYRWLTRLPERFRNVVVRLHPVVDIPSGRTDVLRHFATEVLGLSEPQSLLGTGNLEVNSGLPLRICAALWRDPPRSLWVDQHDNLHLGALKRLLDDELRNLDRTDPMIQEVRHILHGWATERFGRANEEFLSGLGWDRVGWPVPSDEHDGAVHLSEIDELLRRDLPPTAAAALAAHVGQLAALADEEVAALL